MTQLEGPIDVPPVSDPYPPVEVEVESELDEYKRKVKAWLIANPLLGFVVGFALGAMFL